MQKKHLNIFMIPITQIQSRIFQWMLSSDDIRWLGLEVRETERGGPDDEDGFVSFSAKYQLGNQVHYLNERSYFKKLDGRWLYVDGETKFTSAAVSQKVGRNEPCPCGSGKKYKKCCGSSK